MWLKPRTDFGVSKDGIPIGEVQLSGLLHTGIQYSRQVNGLVPPYEEYSAMVTAGYNELEWDSIDQAQRARAVAYRRLALLEQLHHEDARARDSKRQAARQSRR